MKNDPGFGIRYPLLTGVLGPLWRAYTFRCDGRRAAVRLPVGGNQRSVLFIALPSLP